MKLLGNDKKPKEYSSFEKEIKTYLSGNLKPKPIERFQLSDFDSIKKELKKLSESDTLTNFGLSERATQLLEMLPSGQLDNLFQPTEMNAIVSDFEKMKFISLVNIVSNPYIIVNNLADGQLTYRDIDNLGIYYPEILETLTSAVVDETSNYLAKKKYYDLETGIVLNLSKILGVSKLTPSRLKKYQDNFTKKENQPLQQSAALEIPLESLSSTLTNTVQNG